MLRTLPRRPGEKTDAVFCGSEQANGYGVEGYKFEGGFTKIGTELIDGSSSAAAETTIPELFSWPSAYVDTPAEFM
jgi:hypothetical protein